MWQSCGRLTMAGTALRFPRQSSAAALYRAQSLKAALSAERCALPRNDESSVIVFPTRARRVWPPYRGSQSEARLGSLCVSKLHNVSAEGCGLTFYGFSVHPDRVVCGNVKTTHPSHASRAPPSLLGKARRLRRALASLQGSQSAARLGSLSVSKLHNVSVE